MPKEHSAHLKMSTISGPCSLEPGELEATPELNGSPHAGVSEKRQERKRKREKVHSEQTDHHQKSEITGTKSSVCKSNKRIRKSEDRNVKKSKKKSSQDKYTTAEPSNLEQHALADPYQYSRSKFDDDEPELEITFESHVVDSPQGSIPDSMEVEDSQHPLPDGEPIESCSQNSKHEEEELKTPELPDSSAAEEKPNLLPYFPAIRGCRSVNEFRCLNKINEGTYGVVYRALDLKQRNIVAMKRLKLEKEKDGFPITSLREIKLLMMTRHPNVVTIKEVVVGASPDKVYMVMEYVEHDLKTLMDSMKEAFTIGEVKTLMIQLLRGVQHLHDNWVIHRDLKTSNLLLSHSGILKIADFGLAREYGSPLKPYTPIVVTLWYRCPELLLGAKIYSTAVDMWSVGCIFGEFLLGKPVFSAKTEIDQLKCIFKTLGTPNDDIWPGVSELPAMNKNVFSKQPFNQLKKRFEKCLFSEKGFNLMNGLLTYCPEKRMAADTALNHNFFEETPLPTQPSMFPTWPAKSEITTKK